MHNVTLWRVRVTIVVVEKQKCITYSEGVFVTLGIQLAMYKGWNFNSGNYLFTTDTK